MKPDAAKADRMQAVREAARDWFRAGWIDESALRQIEGIYPDDRVRAGITFRILFFVITLCALQGAAVLLYMLTRRPHEVGLLALIAGAAGVFLTEYMQGALRRRQGGIEAAFSTFAVLQLVLAMALINHDAWQGSFESKLTLDLLWAAALCLAAAWRWGYWPYSAVAALLFFLGASHLPYGRLLWILIPILLYRWLSAGCDSPQLPPALRKCSAAFLTVCVLAFYAAGNVYSLDHHIVEFNRMFAPPAPGSAVRWLAIACTAVVPVVVLSIGTRHRRRLFLNLGFLLGIVSLVTVRQYAHLVPPWLALAGGGLVFIVGTLLLKRFLDSGRNGARGGFTAGQLLEDPKKQRALEVLASVAILTPEPKPAQAKSEFQGKGGEFGGGGASGEF